MRMKDALYMQLRMEDEEQSMERGGNVYLLMKVRMHVERWKWKMEEG